MNLTPEQAEALEIARRLAAAGVPVFAATPDDSAATGFKLPYQWQQTAADPAAVDAWQPGMALCAVMGHGLDLLDVDPRVGGDLVALGGPPPVSYGMQTTPSGGMHSFIASLWVRSRDNIAPGIDLKAGDAEGNGRGFAFIAPTVRVSKVTGEIAAYRWVMPPAIHRYVGLHVSGDTSGAALAELVRTLRAGGGGPPSVDQFTRSGPWVDIRRTLAAGRNDGVARLAAGLRAEGGWKVERAISIMNAEVWPLIEQDQSGHEFTYDEFEKTIRAAWRQYPDGIEQRAEERAEERPGDAFVPGPPLPPPSPGRYFDPSAGGFQAATLAEDVMSLGPLAEGMDDRLWSYYQGVWRGDKNVVRTRSAALLGQRYRPTHARNAEDIVRARARTISCDPIPELINFRNGLLDWRTGELRPHTPDVLSTVQLATDYDPGALCPEFEKFIAEVLPPDMVDTAWELIGYLMYSGNPLHKAIMLTGTGRNGKGTLLRVIVHLLGRHNVTTVSLHDLVNTRFSTASLFGKLANIAGDIDAGYLENTATLKAVTGGDMISAEHKGRDRFDFSPWAVPVFSANKIPASADTTVGYLSRWLVVPFPHDFTGREDRTLDARLHDPAELRGIAARGVAALPRLLGRGDFEVTESSRAAREEFARRVDQVRTWLHDCAEVHPDHPFIGRTHLYETYRRWAARDGHKPLRASEFYDRVEAAGAEAIIVRGVRGFRGIKIIDDGWGFQGAAGAGVFNPSTGGAGGSPEGADRGAGEGAARGADEGSVTEGSISVAVSDKGAARPAPTLTSEKGTQGAEGAARPQPPTCARTHGGVGTDLHPLHPRSTPQPKITKAKIAKEAERAEKILAAAGPVGALPAVVLRNGTITPVSITNARAIAWPSTELTVDVETTGYPIGHRDYALRTVQLGDDQRVVVFDAADPEQQAAVRELLAAAPKLHAHSATADLGPLVHAGLTDMAAWERMHDTVLPALLADPGSIGSDAAGLKELAGDVLGVRAVSPAADKARAELFDAARWLTKVEPTTPVERSGWAQVDPRCATMTVYAASDVLDTAALAAELPAPAPAVLDREQAVQRIVARVTHHGVALDGERVDRLHAEHIAARDAIAARARDSFGIANIGSDKQIGAALVELGVDLPRTKKGQPSTAAGVLEGLRNIDGPAGELVRARLDYQHHKTAISLFLQPYAELVHRGDGRARPTIYTLGTSTGRMSSMRPNVQQLPREGGLRACYVADPGYRGISADFSSVEVRVMAALSQDPSLIRMILDGVDLHSVIAGQVFGPAFTKGNRYVTKRGVFGWAYGGGIPELARQVGTSEAVMGRVVDALAQIAPTYVAWAAGLKDAVRQGRTQMPTYAGRVIHLPPDTPHKGPNYAIQGTARELLADALLRWDAGPYGGGVLFPVHDEVVAFVPEADAEAATAELVRCMQNDLYGVPIAAEASEPWSAWPDAS